MVEGGRKLSCLLFHGSEHHWKHVSQKDYTVSNISLTGRIISQESRQILWQRRVPVCILSNWACSPERQTVAKPLFILDFSTNSENVTGFGIEIQSVKKKRLSSCPSEVNIGGFSWKCQSVFLKIHSISHPIVRNILSNIFFVVFFWLSQLLFSLNFRRPTGCYCSYLLPCPGNPSQMS